MWCGARDTSDPCQPRAATSRFYDAPPPANVGSHRVNRSQLVELHYIAPIENVRSILERFRWKEAIDILQPRLVLTNNGGVALQLRDLVPVLHFHQISGLTLSTTVITRPDGQLVRLPTGVRSVRWAEWLVEMGLVRQST